MSYLLDALKKAESERSAKDIESGDISHVIVQKPSNLPVWLVVLMASLLLITIWKLSVSSAVITNHENKSTETTSGETIGADDLEFLLKNEVVVATHKDSDSFELVGFIPVAPTQIKTPELDTYKLKAGEVLIAPGSSESLFKPEQTSNDDTDQINSRELNSSTEVNKLKVKQLAELTKYQLNKIPSLSLQSHLYSSVAEYSSVVINGSNYSEGDFINSEIIIKKINVDGIVISLGELLIELPKGISWVSQNNAK